MKDIIKIQNDIELEQLRKGEAYPATIIMDRYSGTYSGAKWLAFNEHNNEVPDEIGGSDPEESSFWLNRKETDKPIGKGDTPNEAYLNLVAELIKWRSK